MSSIYIVAPCNEQNEKIIELLKRVFVGIDSRITITRKKHPKDIAPKNFGEQGQFFGKEHFILETTYSEYLLFMERELEIIKPIVYADLEKDGKHLEKMKAVFY